jgi:hypothetical protein
VSDRRAATQTLEREAPAWRSLPLTPPPPPPPTVSTVVPVPRAADRIKGALLRWLEEEM